MKSRAGARALAPTADSGVSWKFPYPTPLTSLLSKLHAMCSEHLLCAYDQPSFPLLVQQKLSFPWGNPTSSISGIPGGAVRCGAPPTSPTPKGRQRTPGTSIKISCGEREPGVELLLTTEGGRLEIIQSQPTHGVLPPRLPELPGPLAPQAWLLNTSLSALYISDNLFLLT